MDMQEVNKLIQTFAQYGLTSLELEEGNDKISIKKELYKPMTAAVGGEAADTAVQASVRNMAAQQPVNVQTGENKAAGDIAAGTTAGNTAAQQIAKTEEGRVIKAALVGMFYTSASPEDEPFVRAGDTVKQGQVIGIVEAMKLMNEVTSEFDGVVKEVLVENGQVVEYGQPLFVIG